MGVSASTAHVVIRVNLRVDRNPPNEHGIYEDLPTKPIAKKEYHQIEGNKYCRMIFLCFDSTSSYRVPSFLCLVCRENDLLFTSDTPQKGYEDGFSNNNKNYIYILLRIWICSSEAFTFHKW